MTNFSHMAFPRENEELESTPEALVDCSLLEAAVNLLRRLDPENEVTLNLESILANRRMQPIRIVIDMQQGVINRVASTTDLQWIVHDDDIEGCDDDDWVERPGLDGGTDEVYKSGAQGADVMHEQVNAIFEAAKAEGA